MIDELLRKETFIAVRRLCDEDGNFVAYVPAEGRYVKYTESSRQHHELDFPWTLELGELPPEMYSREKSTHATLSDPNGYLTISKICKNRNAIYIDSKVAKIESREEKNKLRKELFEKQQEAYAYALDFLPKIYTEESNIEDELAL